MAQIQAHPWFKQGLPEGAASMNVTILADAASRPYVPHQTPEALAALVMVRQDSCSISSMQHDLEALIPLVNFTEEAAAAGQVNHRKRVLSHVGGGASSISLDLRQLSDLLTMGTGDTQLMEGSLWHKICRDMSFRERHKRANLGLQEEDEGEGEAEAMDIRGLRHARFETTVDTEVWDGDVWASHGEAGLGDDERVDEGRRSWCEMGGGRAGGMAGVLSGQRALPRASAACQPAV
eukprot:gene10828-10985_t